MAIKSRNDNRVARHERVRKTISGTPEVPRLCVYRSSKNIYAQIIDDVNGKTLAAASSLGMEVENKADGADEEREAPVFGASGAAIEVRVFLGHAAKRILNHFIKIHWILSKGIIYHYHLISSMFKI